MLTYAGCICFIKKIRSLNSVAVTFVARGCYKHCKDTKNFEKNMRQGVEIFATMPLFCIILEMLFYKHFAFAAHI